MAFWLLKQGIRSRNPPFLQPIVVNLFDIPVAESPTLQQIRLRNYSWKLPNINLGLYFMPIFSN